MTVGADNVLLLFTRKTRGLVSDRVCYYVIAAIRFQPSYRRSTNAYPDPKNVFASHLCKKCGSCASMREMVDDEGFILVSMHMNLRIINCALVAGLSSAPALRASVALLCMNMRICSSIIMRKLRLSSAWPSKQRLPF